MEGERICGTSNSVSRKTALHPHVCIVGSPSEEHLDSAASLAPVTGDGWTLAPMSTQRRLHSASVIAGQLYVVGGQNGQGVVLTYAKRFGLVAGVWRALAPMSTQHVVGGVDGQRVLLNSAERLAPVTGVWRALAPMSTAMGAFSICHSWTALCRWKYAWTDAYPQVRRALSSC